MYSINDILFLFIIYSIIGYFYETLLVLITYKYLRWNSGFFIGPYLPTYGVGVLLILLLLNNFTNNYILLFLLSGCVCCTLEFLISYLMEKLFSFRWWDHSNYFFNVQGRTCLRYFIIFGLFGIAIHEFINPVFMNLISILGSDKIIIFNVLLIFIGSIDLIISTSLCSKLKHNIILIPNLDQTAEIKEFMSLQIKKYLFKR